MIHLVEIASRVRPWPLKLALSTMTVAALIIWAIGGLASLIFAMGLLGLIFAGIRIESDLVLAFLGCFGACAILTGSAHELLRVIEPILRTAAEPTLQAVAPPRIHPMWDVDHDNISFTRS